LSLIDALEEKLIDCRDGRSAHCDGDVGSVVGVPGRRGYWSIAGLEIGLMVQLAVAALSRVFSGLFATAELAMSLMRRTASM
jgi:hypothetical protein